MKKGSKQITLMNVTQRDVTGPPVTHIRSAQLIVNNGTTVYKAIVNDRLRALELAITPDMGHGWASDVALSNIHERSSLTSRFLLYKNTKVSIKTP